MKKYGNSVTNQIQGHRLIALFLILFFILFLLMGRLGWIQIVQGPKLKKLALEQWNSEIKIDAKRGEIVDRNGEKLAVSVSCKRIDAYIPDILEAEEDNHNIKSEIASKLAQVLGQDKDNILKKLNSKLSSGLPVSGVTIARKVDNDKGDEIKKLNLPGIVISDDTKRYYPNGNFLSHVIGFTDVDSSGQQGIELTYDEELKGVPGSIKVDTDRVGRRSPFDDPEYNDPINGSTIVLTIDSRLQLYVEKALEEAVVKNKAKSATAIVMDPKTGEILAMASKPDFDPNKPRDMTGLKDVQDLLDLWKNKAVTFLYEPGSVFKVVTTAAALDMGIADENSTFECDGYKVVAGRRIYDWNRKGDGHQSLAQILQNSCNVGFMELGEKIGKEKLYKYIDDFGFGKKTGIDVSYEESGYKIAIDKVGPVELANISFGQGLAVTPIQIAAAYAAIANDGVMMTPHLVKSIESADQSGDDSAQIVQANKSRRIMDDQIADRILRLLETVVTDGGSENAAVEGYRIAGKTGTAQKAENGKYAKDKYVTSFAGMAPVDNPQYVVYVAVDEPDPSNYYASQVAAPVARQIFKDIFTLNNIPPDENLMENNKDSSKNVQVKR